MRVALLTFSLLAAGCGMRSPPTCDPTCGGGFACVDGVCVPTGAPDLAAPTGGGCRPACGGTTPFCNDKNRCVGCRDDGDCPAMMVCKVVSDAIATCTPGCKDDTRCGAGKKCCGGRCADVQSDASNCGGCNARCTGQHAAVACAAGKCTFSGRCDPGWGDCNGVPGDGCETNLHVTPNHCTACGMKCSIANALAACANGCYAAACNYGFDDCNRDEKDGCETSVVADPKNCGGCGKQCAGLPNAAAACVSAACVLASCNTGFADCDQMAKTGCEVNTATDPLHCGKCGNACGPGLICKGGGCTCQMCNIPNASALCQNNMCVFDRCNPGFADCNNNLADGCEVNLNADSKNCSQCGAVCPMNTPNCVSGKCSTLPPSFATWGGWQWFKIQAQGAMNDDTVFKTCQNAGLTVPCDSQDVNCQYNDNLCKKGTPENDCGNPMIGLSRAICNGGQPSQCQLLWGVYQYMGHKWNGNSACGAEMNSWCSDGKSQMNRFALCVVP